MFIPKSALRMVDKGFSQLVREMKEIKRRGECYAKAGVLGSGAAREDDGTRKTNVDIALIHEYGAPRAGIPERSFIRSTFTAKRSEYVSLLRTMAPKIFAMQLDVKQALGLVGLKMAADMKSTISGGLSPPLAASTIRRRLLLGARARGTARLARREMQVNMAAAVFGGDAVNTGVLWAKGVSRLEKSLKRKGDQMAMAAAVFGNAGGHKPLIDTGQLLNSITHAVVLGSTEEKG